MIKEKEELLVLNKLVEDDTDDVPNLGRQRRFHSFLDERLLECSFKEESTQEEPESGFSLNQEKFSLSHCRVHGEWTLPLFQITRVQVNHPSP